MFILVLYKRFIDKNINMTKLEDIKENIKILSGIYYLYKEKTFKNRRFKHNDIETLIKKLKQNTTLEISELGKSTENRSINLIKLGKYPNPLQYIKPADNHEIIIFSEK